MNENFEERVQDLYEKSYDIFDRADFFRARRNNEKYEVKIAKEYKEQFNSIIEKVTLSLMEDKENFYGYFLFQMERQIRFDMDSPSGINFKNAKYMIYFNPILFLQLDMNQMKSTVKHEILHVVSRHLLRVRELKGKVSSLAMSLAMDIAINQYLDYLPPYSVTLSGVNNKYSLDMTAYNTLEYYAFNIQKALNIMEESKKGSEDDSQNNTEDDVKFKPETAHDIWQESSSVDEKTLTYFTEQYVKSAEKGTLPLHVQSLVDELKNTHESLPWNLYLKKIMGTVESSRKKTVTRRNRRQPERLDLRGELRSHKAEIAVAIDISGSISNEEFRQAVKEVFGIIKNYNHEISIIECDNEIRRVYKVRSEKDVKDRKLYGGGTKFTPVFEYCNKKHFDLLIFFTDGKGEKRLEVIPRGYTLLWVISGRGEKLSLDNPHGYVKKLDTVKVIDTSVDLKDIKTDGYSMNNQEPIF